MYRIFAVYSKNIFKLSDGKSVFGQLRFSIFRGPLDFPRGKKQKSRFHIKRWYIYIFHFEINITLIDNEASDVCIFRHIYREIRGLAFTLFIIIIAIIINIIIITGLSDVFSCLALIPIYFWTSTGWMERQQRKRFNNSTWTSPSFFLFSKFNVCITSRENVLFRWKRNILLRSSTTLKHSSIKSTQK